MLQWTLPNYIFVVENCHGPVIAPIEYKLNILLPELIDVKKTYDTNSHW